MKKTVLITLTLLLLLSFLGAAAVIGDTPTLTPQAWLPLIQNAAAEPTPTPRPTPTVPRPTPTPESENK